MDSKVAILCIVLIFVLSMKGSKTQKGGSKAAVVVGLIVASAAGLGLYFALSSSSDDSKKKTDGANKCSGTQCPSGKVMKEGVSDTVSKMCFLFASKCF